MRPLTASELLDLWQDTALQPPIERALRLVGTACDMPSPRDAARLSIGERDLRLLQLREWLFGKQLHNLVNCPVCGALAEWQGDLDALRLQPGRDDDTARRFSLETQGFRLCYRLPNSEDFFTTRDAAKILNGCILSAETENGPCPPEECPAEVLEILAEEMERHDPQADIRFTVHCPSCAHHWETNFDIGSYLWAEIDGWARRTLEEVCTLASHFGWSEQAILRLSPGRRQLYLQLIQR